MIESFVNGLIYVTHLNAFTDRKSAPKSIRSFVSFLERLCLYRAMRVREARYRPSEKGRVSTTEKVISWDRFMLGLLNFEISRTQSADRRANNRQPHRLLDRYLSTLRQTWILLKINDKIVS